MKNVSLAGQIDATGTTSTLVCGNSCDGLGDKESDGKTAGFWKFTNIGVAVPTAQGEL
jgi:hypothetical protein